MSVIKSIFNKSALLFSALAVMFLSGCSPTLQSKAPVPDEFYPLTHQKHMQAAHHWRVLAEDVSKQISTVNTEKSIYVSEASDTTPFNSAFRNMLITQLHKNGLKVSRENNLASVLEFNTQIIKHKDRSTIMPIKGSSFALLGGTLAIVKLVGDASLTTGLAILTAADYASSGLFGSYPVTEVIITTSIYDGNSLLKATTDVYYIGEGDADHYQKEDQMKNLQVVSKWAYLNT